MIKLTRLDGEAFVLNAELIRYVDRRGDTFVTLNTGERIVVRESLEEVVDRSIAYQQQKHFLPPPPPLPLATHRTVPAGSSPATPSNTLSPAN
jgi:flagellar protein FlbD